MPLSDRNILITPNRGSSTEPTIRFTGADTSTSATIVLRVLNSSTTGIVSFEGNAGQLFSIVDSLTGSIFSVNDISGIPSIEVVDTGEIRLAQYNGYVNILGNTNATATNTGVLRVVGGAGIGRDLYVGGTIYGNISGTVTGNAGTVSTVQRTTNAAHFLTFVDSNNASATAENVYTTSSLLVNPGNGSIGINATPITTSSASKIYIGSDLTFYGSNRSLLGNLYYDTDWKYAANGYGWGFREDNAGKLQIVRAGNNTSGTAATAVVSLNDLFTFDLVNNNVGLGQSTPTTKLDITGGLRVTSITTLTNTTNATSTTTGALQVVGGVGIGGSLWVENSIFSKGGTIDLRDDTTASIILASMQQQGSTVVWEFGRTDISNSPAIDFHSSGANIDYDTRIQSIGGNTSTIGQGRLDLIANQIYLSSSQVATSTQTGALRIVGGTGIGGDLYVGGTIYGNISGTVTGNAGTVSTVQQTSTLTHYLTFVDSNNASATAESIYTTSSFAILPSSGNLGLGTTTPTFKLQVLTSAQGTDGIYVYNGNQYVTLRPNMSSGSNNGIVLAGDGGIIFSTGTMETGAFVITPWSSSTSGLRMTSAGRVGIGLSTPTSTLHVSGDARITGITTVTNTTNATSTITGALQVAGGVGVGGSLYVGGEIVAQKLTIELTTVTTTLVTTDDIIKTTNTTNATSTITGALQVAGGAGIGRDLYVGGTIYGNISGTVTGSLSNALTMDNTGSGAASGTTYNGSTARTISYNTIGSPKAASAANSVYSLDSRAVADIPSSRDAGLYVDFKTNSTDGLTDGGTYHGVLTFRSYGFSTDLSGGQVQQIAYTENNNLWHRLGASTSTWGSWIKVIDTGNTSTTHVASAHFAATAGTVTGNAGTVSTIQRTTDATHYLTFVDSNNSSATAENIYTTSSVTVNPGTGNLGIGTTGPIYKIDVLGTSTAAASGNTTIARFSQSSDGGISLLFSNSVGSLARFSAAVTSSGAGTDDGVFTFETAINGVLGERLRIDNVGTLIQSGVAGGGGNSIVLRGGTGATSEGPQIVMGYGNNTSSAITGQANYSWNIDVAAGLANNNFRIFRQNSAGATVVGLEITEATGGSQLWGIGVGTTASNVQGELRATNEITAYFSSDERLKENINLIAEPLTLINQIRGVRFDWKNEHIEKRGGEDGYFVRKHDVGVIAQEVEKVLPEVVAQRNDGYLAVKYEKMIPLLIESIKELNQKIKTLEQKISDLSDKT